MEQLTALLSYSLSVYGIAWILTKSRLFLFLRKTTLDIRNHYRDLFLDNPIGKSNKILYKIKRNYIALCKNLSNSLDYLFNCIVCTSAWAALVLLLFVEDISLLYYALPVQTITDYIFYIGFSVATTWLIASQVGDAE